MGEAETEKCGAIVPAPSSALICSSSHAFQLTTICIQREAKIKEKIFTRIFAQQKVTINVLRKN